MRAKLVMSTRLSYFKLAVCSILYFVPLFRVSHTGDDDGTLITAAARVAEGQIPFRDFVEVMGPGTFYWLALFFKVLGTSWLATRICLLLTTLVITLLLYYLARRFYFGLGAAPVLFFVAGSIPRLHSLLHSPGRNI